MFRSSRDLSSQIRKAYVRGSNDEVVQYGCDLCEQGGWTSETEVEVHKATTHFDSLVAQVKKGKKKNLCCICMKQCADKKELIGHIKKEHLLSSENCTRVEREIFICDTCSSIFFNKQNLGVHLSYSHTNSRVLRIKCPICSKMIKTVNITCHFYKHNVQSVSTCRICLVKCRNLKDLNEHLKTHPPFLKCEMCNVNFKTVESFDNHIHAHHKNSQPCVDSGNIESHYMPSTWSYFKLQRVPGVRGTRLTNDVSVCVFCREVCVGSDEMLAHSMEHRVVKEPVVEVKTTSYKCSCGAEFNNKVLLKHHAFKSNHSLDTK